MIGLVIVVGVAGIVAAFNSCVDLYKKWKHKREDRSKSPQNQNLERSLTLGGTSVQQEYNTHFARLGQQFARGDGELLPIYTLEGRIGYLS